MRFIHLLSLIALLVVTSTRAATTWESDVQPLLKKHCTGCHNPDKRKADLDLTTYAGLLKGSSGGEIVKAGVPDTSWIYETITHAEGVEPMPPKKPKLPEKEIATIRAWIHEGLIENGGGKSMLRKIEFDVTAVSSIRPEEEPAMPETVPEVTLAESARPVAVTALTASRWAPLVAVSGQEQILLKHAESGELLGVLPFPEGTVHVLQFSRNSSVLLAGGGIGGKSGKVVLFDVKSGRRLAEIGDEQDSVLAADLSADHRFVALGGPARIVKIFDTQTGDLLHRIDKHTDWITAVAFAPEGDQLATADRNGGIHVWEAEKAGIIYSLNEHKVRVTDLVWRADSRMLASGAEDGKLVLWDMKDGWPAKVIDAHREKAGGRYTRQTGILALDWNPSGELGTVGRDRVVRFWKSDGAPVGEITELPALPTALAFTIGDRNGLVGGLDGSNIVFKEGKLNDSIQPQ